MTRRDQILKHRVPISVIPYHQFLYRKLHFTSNSRVEMVSGMVEILAYHESERLDIKTGDILPPLLRAEEPNITLNFYYVIVRQLYHK